MARETGNKVGRERPPASKVLLDHRIMGWGGPGIRESTQPQWSAYLQLFYNAKRTGGQGEQKVKVSSGGREMSRSTC